MFRVQIVFSVHIHHENLVAANQRATREAALMRAPVISMRVENAKTVVEEVSEDFQTLHHLGVLILGGVHKWNVDLKQKLVHVLQYARRYDVR